MKKNLFFLAAIGAIALTSCSNDETIVENAPNLAQPENAAINFGFELKNATRADKVGSDAATTLQNQFIVYATKHASAEAADATNDKVAFQNYVVEYEANSAGHTESNTNNWDYVGKTPYAAGVSPTVASQGIKYWDYSAAEGYTFYGIASKNDITNDKVTITKTTTGTTVYDKGYSVVIKNGANLDQLFVADRLPVAKSSYGKPVTLKFRNFGTRVRVGFYETVPGYTVTIDKFYYDNDATGAVTTFAAMDAGNTTNFAASLQNINTAATSNTMTVSYYNGTNGPENQVKLAASTAEYNYTLTLGTGVAGTELATSAAAPTWDQTAGAYTTVYPFEANSNPLLLKIDYTLTPEDGSDGVIVVKNANVVVPTQYVQWKSNFAYTYLFKISDNTNGNTGIIGTDPEGLFPITFDAVVVDIADDKTQETITNFENYSITTYANGSKVLTNNEYKAGETIYVVKTNNSTGAVVAPTAIGTAAGNVQVYVASTTGDAISEATVKAKLTGAPNGITLTATTEGQAASLVADGKVPAADATNYDFGANGAIKFTPSPAAAATYVVVYTRVVNVAPTYAAVGEAAYSGLTTYYFKTSADVYYAAAGINADNFATYKSSLYTQTDAGTPGEYDIKVIKVKP